MKKNSLYIGIVGFLLLSCLIAWRARGYGGASHVTAHREGASINQYPRWIEQQDSGDKEGPGRVALFEKSGECGYIDRWSKGVSPRFIVFLMKKIAMRIRGFPRAIGDPFSRTATKA